MIVLVIVLVYTDIYACICGSWTLFIYFIELYVHIEMENVLLLLLLRG